MSELSPQRPSIIVSGAIYAQVPIDSAVTFVLSAAINFPRPRSEILHVPSWAKRQLQVFMSRCAILLECKENRPLHMSSKAFLPLQKGKIAQNLYSRTTQSGSRKFEHVLQVCRCRQYKQWNFSCLRRHVQNCIVMSQRLACYRCSA